MKTLMKLSGMLGLLAALSFGQVTTTQTTLSGALTASNTPVCLASATSAVAGAALMIDREYMIINSVTSNSLCFNVTRGVSGTATYPHATSSVVWVGPTGGNSGSPFRNLPPQGGAGSPCSSLVQEYLPQISVGGNANGAAGSIWSCPLAAAIVAPNMWTMVEGPVSIGAEASLRPYYAADVGANNAVTAAIPGLAQVAGVCVLLKLGHTLQAGANTFALNGATAKNIKSSRNVANDIGVAYAATGTINLCYDGTEYVDTAQ